MITAASLFCIATLVLEELYLHFGGYGRSLPVWAALLEGPSGQEVHRQRQKLRYRLVKMLQFAAFALLWLLAGSRAGNQLMTSSFGQITTQMLMMQVLRVLGRQVASNRAFLTVMACQQAFLAILVPFLAKAHMASGMQVHPVNWLAGAALAMALLAFAVCFSAVIVYLIRLKAGRDRAVHSSLPPLASSESLARRAFLTGIPCLLAAMALMLIEPGGIQAGAAMSAALALLPAPVATTLYLDRRRLHHPAANLLAAATYPLLLGLVLAGQTAMPDIRA